MSGLKQPYSLQGVGAIIIKEPEYYVDSDDDIRDHPDSWDPVRVLAALEELPLVKPISIDVNQIMLHSGISDEEPQHHYERPVPEHVLGQLGLPCQSTDVCAWSVESHPKVLIHHSTIRRLLFESQHYKDSVEMWKYIVSRQQAKPEYKALDHTAEFHSRDICGPEARCAGPMVDLGLWGAGNYHCGSVSELSMDFVRGFKANTLFLTRSSETWRSDLYARLRRSSGSVSSVLSFDEC